MQWQYLLTPFVIHPRSINLFCFPICHDLRTLQNMFLLFVKTCRVFSLLIAALTAHLYINLRTWFVNFGYYFLKIIRLFKLMLISSVMHESSMLRVLLYILLDSMISILYEI